MMPIVPILIILCVLVVLLLVAVWVSLWLRVKKLKALASESEEKQRQIMIEQERNRQLKQEMTSNIAHELKTPVASIRGYLEILLGDKPLDEEKRRYFLDRCYSQTLRLSDLIHDVSLINKLEEATDYYPKVAIDVRSISEEAVSEMNDRALAQNISITNSIPSVTIQGDHSLVYAIFRNLLDNSISYAGQGVKICMECYRPDPEVLYLHFFDTGCGVGNEYLGKIFDRFQRVDGGRSRKNGGTGLGLSIVKHAVQFHGGTIYAKNRDEGGLEFFFSLRITQKNESTKKK